MIMLALLESLVVLSIAAMIVYAAHALNKGHRRGDLAHATGRWEATHYAAGNSTRVVVRKVVPVTGRVLDEHLVALINDGDTDYDRKFLEAMAQARARAALFTSETD
jgi:hypothetical protein